MSAQKVLIGSEVEMRELLGGTEEYSFSPEDEGSLFCHPGKSLNCLPICPVPSKPNLTLLSKSSSIISRFSLSMAIRRADRPRGSQQFMSRTPLSLLLSSILSEKRS